MATEFYKYLSGSMRKTEGLYKHIGGSFKEIKEKWVMIGGSFRKVYQKASATWSIGTFPSVTGEALGAIITSASRTVTVLDGPILVSCSTTNSGKMSVSGGPFLSGDQLVNHGQSIRVQVRSSYDELDWTSVTCSAEGDSATFLVQTGDFGG